MFWMLLALAAVLPLYLAINAGVVFALDRYCPPLWRMASVPMRRLFRMQLRALSMQRIWGTVVLHMLLLAGFIVTLREPLSLLALPCVLLGYIFLVSALTLSLLARLPYVQALWDDPARKLSIWFVPLLLGFIAKGYAAQWLGELLETSAANASYALFAGTAFILCLGVAILLGLAGIAFEVGILATSVRTASRHRPSRSLGLLLLMLMGFMATFVAGDAALQMPSGRLGNRLLFAIAFEFDASPATHCNLTTSERRLTEGDEPFLKALHLSSSHEKALLVRRMPPLFRAALLKELKAEKRKSHYLEIVRVADCYKVPRSVVEDVR